MSKSTRVRFIAGAVCVSASMSTGAQAPRDAGQWKAQLVGSYTLISYTSFDGNGAATRLPYSVGQISYDPAGRMSAQLMRDNRPKLTPGGATEAERAAAYSSFISYFGRYEVDAAKRTVTHHVEGAMSPNMVGSALVRHFEFSPDGRSLFLSVKDGERVTGRLQWDRYR